MLLTLLIVLFIFAMPVLVAIAGITFGIAWVSLEHLITFIVHTVRSKKK